MRQLNDPKAIKAWEDAYNYKPEPVVIEVPVISYVLMSTVASALGVAMFLLMPGA